MHAKLVLCAAMMGVAVLLAFTEFMPVEQELIARMDQIPEGDETKLTGVVTRLTERDKVLFIDLAEERIETIPVVVFKDSNITLNEGDVITVTGSVTIYNGKKEVVASRLERR